MATIKFVQAQKFVLAGSGASIGDTTITLQSMTGIDGALITTSDIGIKAYGTLEPGNGAQEEQVSFTGVTQNANGTATLTGVNTVLFTFPYTETSGLVKTHAGATTFILSNDAGFYGQILNYIDTAIVSGGVPATTTVLGLNKMSVAPVSPGSPIAVGDNDPRLSTVAQNNYLASIVNTAIPYAVASGTSTAYTASVASAISTLSSGTYLNFLVPATNATGVTLNVNSLGAKPLKKRFNVALASGDLTTGQIVSAIYDGTNFQLTVPTVNNPGFVNGQLGHDVSSNTTDTLAHGLGTTPRFVKATIMFGLSTGFSVTCLSYVGSSQASVSLGGGLGTSSAVHNGADGVVTGTGDTGSNYTTAGLSAPDATNIYITWSKTGSPAGTAYIMWEAYA